MITDYLKSQLGCLVAYTIPVLLFLVCTFLHDDFMPSVFHSSFLSSWITDFDSPQCYSLCAMCILDDCRNSHFGSSYSDADVNFLRYIDERAIVELWSILQE